MDSRKGAYILKLLFHNEIIRVHEDLLFIFMLNISNTHATRVYINGK
jgi:hypothetical protein